MFYIKVPAKINLALDIQYRRPDGYHEVDMIMQSITLADEIWLSDSNKDCLFCNHPKVPADESNIVLKALNLLREYTNVKRNLGIRIFKEIPVAAGMAGGSTDAAALLLGLNQFWNLGLPLDKLLELGLRLGADVPFCILKGTYRAQGIGEKLTKVKSSLNFPVFLITPDVSLTTVSVYKGYNSSSVVSRPNMDQAIYSLEKGDLDNLTMNWGNVLENSARQLCLPLEELFCLLKKWKFRNFLMSGSGPTVFLIDPPHQLLARFLKEIPEKWFTCFSEMIL